MTTKSKKPRVRILFIVLTLALIMLIPAAAYASDDVTAEPATASEPAISPAESTDEPVIVHEPVSTVSEPVVETQPAETPQTDTNPVEQSQSDPANQPADLPTENNETPVSDDLEASEEQPPIEPSSFTEPDNDLDDPQDEDVCLEKQELPAEDEQANADNVIGLD
ncbi:MAG: hypothetical protein MUP57_01810, partial [Clostridia bacterium]|nr:hypothetical protein [Clostridia bacterium]